MPPSTTSYFPDINVWVALTYEGHVHHEIAAEWRQPATKDWPDSYLAAFATIGRLTAVTFEQGTARTKARSAVLPR